MGYLDFVPTNGAANAEGVLQSRASSFGAWATERSGGSTPVLNSVYTGEIYYAVGSTSGVNLFYIQRNFSKIAYSGIPANATITDVTYNYYCRDGVGATEIRNRMVLCLGMQSATLVAGDWTGISTEYGRDASTSWGGNGWISFSLNAAGKAAVVNGATVKYCFTTVNDFDNVQPPDNSACGIVYNGPANSNASIRPYIRVSYTVPSTSNMLLFF